MLLGAIFLNFNCVEERISTTATVSDLKQLTPSDRFLYRSYLHLLLIVYKSSLVYQRLYLVINLDGGTLAFVSKFTL